jgi:hypothetical protein
MRFTWFLAVLLCVSGLARADEGDWVLDSTRDGIVSYTRTIPGQSTLDFRAVVRVKADFLSTVTALANVEHMPDWWWHMKATKVLEDKDLDDLYLYLHIDGIPPVSDRDVVLKAELWQDPISLEMDMDGRSVDYSNMPPQSGRVRIPFMTAGFKVRPITPDVTEVEVSGSVDPGGAIPVWVSNQVITIMPRWSLDKLRTMISKSSYQEYLRKGRQTDGRWDRLFRTFKFTPNAN